MNHATIAAMKIIGIIVAAWVLIALVAEAMGLSFKDERSDHPRQYFSGHSTESTPKSTS